MRTITIPPKTQMQPGDFGPAPMLQWIAIENLVVDDTYQRELGAGNWSAIKRIAQQFRWSRFSPVFVAPVERGRFAIIDGQHRVHAALMRGVAEVPCQVVQMSRQEQASAFAAINGLVTKVTTWQILKAALAAGEKWAVDASALCERAGCRLMVSNASADAKKAGEIYAVGLVRTALSCGFGPMLEFSLRELRSSEFGSSAEAYGSDVLKPLLSVLMVRPWLLKAGVPLARFFDDFDVWKALDDSAVLAKEKRRHGESMPKHELASAMIGEGLDKAFPQRMALPKGGDA